MIRVLAAAMRIGKRSLVFGEARQLGILSSSKWDGGNPEHSGAWNGERKIPWIVSAFVDTIDGTSPEITSNRALYVDANTCALDFVARKTPSRMTKSGM